ncbi:MAG: hypothetical protein AB1898_28115 [Acidobacteriota bacterium]
MAIEKNNQTKAVSPTEPFVRIQSREFNPQSAHADGKGRDCGCRNTEDYDSIFLAAILAFGLDELEDLVPIPSQLKNAANQALKSGTGKDLDDFKKELSQFLGNTGEGLIFGSGLRQVPTWVPVGRKVTRDKDGKKTFDPNFKEKDKEVAGILSRSFQSCTDLPLLPWQRFYNWNFHVRVDRDGVVVDSDGVSQKGKGGFLHVIGVANIPNDSEQEVINVDPNRAAFDVAPPSGIVPGGPFFENSLECVLDTGAFSRSPGNVFDSPSRTPLDRGGDVLPGVMFHPRWPFWPMTNDYFWAQGRWVFDCSHVVDGDFFSDGIDRHWTQIHPIRAFACSRSEGFKFDENQKRVQASRFLFFACRMGGYIDLPPFSELDPADDPKFIVDLPPAPVSEELIWSIGHTEQFDLNTGVLRPRLLIKTEFAPFGIPTTFFQEGVHFAHKVDPIIEPIRSSPDKKVFDQVKITVPLSNLPKGAPAFGFVTSLGWADPTNELAARVKKVTVSFDRLRDLDKDGELRFKFCVNGHWVYGPFHDVNDENLNVGGSLTVFLPEDAKVSLSVHGQERHGHGEFFEEEKDADRQLHVGGLFPFGSGKLQETINSIKKQLELGQQVIDISGNQVAADSAKALLKVLEGAAEILKERRAVQWLKDVDQPDDGIASAVARELFFKPFPIFNKKDVPLGFVDDDHPHHFGFETGRLGDSPSVLLSYVGDTMAGLVKDFQAGTKSRTVTVLAHQTEVAGDAHLLSYKFFNDEKGRDYLLQFTISVEEQP